MMQCTDECRLIAPEAMREVMARTLLVNLKEGSKIDLPGYQLDFTLQQLTPDGVLLTLK
jgi:hypothetical protein